jgi:hypothetical protein
MSDLRGTMGHDNVICNNTDNGSPATLSIAGTINYSTNCAGQDNGRRRIRKQMKGIRYKSNL